MTVHRLCASLVALPAVLLLASAPALPQDQPRQLWQRQFYGTIAGGEALLYGGSTRFAKPAVGDLNGDDLPDLLLGRQDGRISFYRNEGKRRQPAWRLVEEAITAQFPAAAGAAGAVEREIAVGGFAAPALVDIDGDGDLDLFVGTADGRLMFFRNTGNTLAPRFALENEQFLSGGFGKRLAPFFADVDGDRAPDLFLGNAQGEVTLMMNQGDLKRARFCTEFPSANALPEEAPPCTPAPRKLLSVEPIGHAVPALVDWNGDGDLDLFVGKADGTLDYYENRGNRREPDWMLRQLRFLAIDDGGYAAPAFTDINADGKADLIVGANTGRLTVYTGRDARGPLDVWKATGNLLNMQQFGRLPERLVVATGDLRGSGLLAMIVGNRDGTLAWYDNLGTRQRPAWKLVTENLLPGLVHRNAAPLLIDIDGDGDLDLLVGGADGRLWLIRNEGTLKQPLWRLDTTEFAGINVGSNAVPAAVDIDGDGDLELFVGNGRGFVVFYRNQGSAKQPDFVLASTQFGGFQYGANAAPAFLDVNDDKKVDMIVGGREGQLMVLLNQSPEKEPMPRNWLLQSRSWENFQAEGFSAPHLADLNGDGKPELLVGDGGGNLLLWLNGGVARPAVAASAAPEPAANVLPLPPAPPAPVAPVAAGQVAPEPARPADATEKPKLGESPQPVLGPIAPVYALVTNKYADLQFEGRAVPAFADVDGDGDLDLVVGTGKGQLVYFRNDGTAKAARWTKVTENLGGYKGGRNPSPILADLDGDGRPELLVGTEDGAVLLFKNTAASGDPVFVLQAEALAGVRVRRFAAPAIGPVNDDARADLVIGDFSGTMMSFLGKPGGKGIAFTLNSRAFLGIKVGVSATPFFGDLDRDGVAELIIGSDQGSLLNFRRVPPSVKNIWGWEKGPDYFRGLKFPPGATPRLVDLDGDGNMDLMVGSERGTLYHYHNDAALPGGGAP
ncbi:MAG: VCBS repeat-containing protein [Candidatus Lambdaproteobacteria bacterium]|nr:VCBS repeat-containing protein [Candidatus Lambdaproteobacteria bacterium]